MIPTLSQPYDAVLHSKARRTIKKFSWDEIADIFENGLKKLSQDVRWQDNLNNKVRFDIEDPDIGYDRFIAAFLDELHLKTSVHNKSVRYLVKSHEDARKKYSYYDILEDVNHKVSNNEYTNMVLTAASIIIYNNTQLMLQLIWDPKKAERSLMRVIKDHIELHIKDDVHIYVLDNKDDLPEEYDTSIKHLTGVDEKTFIEDIKEMIVPTMIDVLFEVWMSNTQS